MNSGRWRWWMFGNEKFRIYVQMPNVFLLNVFVGVDDVESDEQSFWNLFDERGSDELGIFLAMLIQCLDVMLYFFSIIKMLRSGRHRLNN